MIICILRGIYRSFVTTTQGWRGNWVAGCDYKTDDEPTPDNVHVIRCQRCGHCSMSWSWSSLEQIK